MSDEERFQALIRKNDLPPLEGVADMRFRMGFADWYALTEAGWWYCRTDGVRPENRKWAFCPYGPST